MIVTIELCIECEHFKLEWYVIKVPEVSRPEVFMWFAKRIQELLAGKEFRGDSFANQSYLEACERCVRYVPKADIFILDEFVNYILWRFSYFDAFS